MLAIDFSELYRFMLEADQSISQLVASYGTLTYSILFLIIFIETGLVVITFFPGDGILFSAGILASSGELNLWLLLVILIFATVLGNTCNYLIGRYIGHRFFKKEVARRNKLLAKAFTYYDAHENKSIVLSRFFPVLRSFVPFVAGITSKPFRTFNGYNIIGGVIWISTYILLGFFFGTIPWVRENYGLILSITFVSILVVLLVGLIGFLIRQFFAQKVS